MKEQLPHDTRFVITNRKKEFHDIAQGLQDHDRQGFFEATGRPDFQQDRRAINVYGEPVAGCSDETRLEGFMKAQGYTERITPQEARKKPKKNVTVYKRPTRHERKYGRKRK